MQGASGVLPFQFGETWLQSGETRASFGLLAGILTAGLILAGISMLGAGSKKKKRTEKLVKKFPGPGAYPVVGNAGQLKMPAKDLFDWLGSVPQQWGKDVVRFWSDGTPKLLINSYTVAQQLCSEIGTAPQKSKDALVPVPEGHSLARITADMHIFQKRCQDPGLSLRVKQDAFEIYCRHATKMRYRLTESVSDGRPFDVLEYARTASFQIACERTMGHELFQDLWEMDYRSQLDAWHQLHSDLLRDHYNPFEKYDLSYLDTNVPKAGRPHLEKIQEFGELAIFLRRQRWDYLKDNRFLNEDLPKIQGTPGCLLDLLLQLEDQELTRSEVLHDLNLALLSGYDTTGPCLAWVLQLLASHPKIQSQCVDEIQQVLLRGLALVCEEEPRPGSSRAATPPSLPSVPSPPHTTAYYTLSSRNFYGDPLPLTPTLLNNLSYLDRVITEALRLYPAFPWQLDPLPHDLSLDDGQVIPAGVAISLNSYSLHRDPIHFPDHLEFRPDRPSESCPPLLPFATGLRSRAACLQDEDKLQLKILLVHLLLAFHWESHSNDLDATNNNKSSRRNSEDGRLFSTSLVGSDGSSRVSVKIVPTSR